VNLPLKHAARLAVVAAALVAAFAHAPSAPAAVPCWKQLLTDWYDGRIDKTYPIPCYRETLKHLPTDVDVYSSARTDIQRALASAIAKRNHKQTTTSVKAATTTKSATPPPARRGTTTTTTARPTTTRPRTTTTPAVSTQPGSTDASSGRRNDNGPIGEALDKINPGSADSLPLPLLILGALAILLVAAGLAGMVVRRTQARRLGP
jgi:hypothetical protein